MMRTKKDLAKYVLRSALAIVRAEDDLEDATLEEVINEYELLYAELKETGLVRTIDSTGQPIEWQADEIPPSAFKALANITAARCAAVYAVHFEPILEEEAKRWLFKIAQIPSKRKPMVIRQF